MAEDATRGQQGPGASKALRAARSAEALRANLRRRKAQARDREAARDAAPETTDKG